MDSNSDPSEPTPESRIGSLIAQRYRIVSVLGEGGIGYVFLGEDQILRMKVAIKILKREVAGEPEVVARFDREAKAMAALGHDHIVNALNFGRTPEGDIILVMEYIEGETLRTTIKKARPNTLPVPITVEIAR